jgi:glutathione synthase
MTTPKTLRTVAFIIDPIESFNRKKDSTIALMLACQDRGAEVFSLELSDLWVEAGRCYGWARSTQWTDAPLPEVQLQTPQKICLHDVDMVWMRKDPPFDMEYVYATYALDLVAQDTLVCNNPTSLRSFNEKFLVHHFPQFAPPTLTSRNAKHLHEFLNQHGKVVFKPLNRMGGQNIFVVDAHDRNRQVVIETLTHNGQETIMAQKYLPEIAQGDQRILLFCGQPLPHKVVRMPSQEDHRGNLAAGATANIEPLSARQQEICKAIAPFCIQHGLYFVGLDTIGDFVTEINITCPTTLREMDQATGQASAHQLLDAILTM